MVGKDTTVISLALPKELNAKAEKKAKQNAKNNSKALDNNCRCNDCKCNDCK